MCDDATAFAAGFYLIELAMVALMAAIIQQMGDVVKIRPHYHEAFVLAAIAPTPLWFAPIALFLPSMWINIVVEALAWVASAALIYHGVPALLRMQDHSRSRTMASFVLTAGVIAWFTLLGAMALGMSIVIGLR